MRAGDSDDDDSSLIDSDDSSEVAVKATVLQFAVNFKPFKDKAGWTRVMVRNNNQMHLSYGGNLTPQDIVRMKIKDIGWSDNEYSIVTNESWYMENVVFSTNTPLPINQVVANVFNGLAPRGTQWKKGTKNGYLKYSGVVKTYGDFKSFYMGWNFKAHIHIGTYTTLRSGGGPKHTGEFIHSSCNGYSKKQHSITLRIGWPEKRVFWIRTHND